MYSIENVAWYCVVTLRDSCLEYHLQSLRKFYPDLKVYVLDNNAGPYNITPIAEKYNCAVLANTGTHPLPLTVTQDSWSKELFKSHSVLCFSADDIQIFEGGFIERSLDLLNQGSDIVSFATERDAVAYMYNEKYFTNVGFNVNMPGKEATDQDLKHRVITTYGTFPHVGEYWQSDTDFWRSRYVGNPHMDKFGKDDVNKKLGQMNINH